MFKKLTAALAALAVLAGTLMQPNVAFAAQNDVAKTEIVKAVRKDGKLSVQWKSVDGAAAYDVRVSDGEVSSDYTAEKNKLSTADEHKKIKELAVRVRAYKNVGTRRYYGEWSDAWTLVLNGKSRKGALEQKLSWSSNDIKNGRAAFGAEFFVTVDRKGNAPLSYASSDENVLSVTPNGQITAKGYGTASIKVQAGATFECESADAEIAVEVVPEQVVLTYWDVTENSDVILQWNPCREVSGYEYSMAEDDPDFKDDRKMEWKKTEITIKNFNTEADALYMRVRAYKKVGDKIYYGNWSESKCKRLKGDNTDVLI